MTNLRVSIWILTAVMLCASAAGDTKADDAALRARLAIAERLNAELASTLAQLKAEARAGTAIQAATSKAAAATATQRANTATKQQSAATAASETNDADAREAVTRAEQRASTARQQADEAEKRINELATAATHSYTLVWVAAITGFLGFAGTALKSWADEQTRGRIAAEKQAELEATEEHRAKEIEKIAEVKTSTLEAVKDTAETTIAELKRNAGVEHQYTHEYVHGMNSLIMIIQAHLQETNPGGPMVAALNKYLAERETISDSLKETKR